jgi:hypothetical protein
MSLDAKCWLRRSLSEYFGSSCLAEPAHHREFAERVTGAPASQHSAGSAPLLAHPIYGRIGVLSLVSPEGASGNECRQKQRASHALPLQSACCASCARPILRPAAYLCDGLPLEWRRD